MIFFSQVKLASKDNEQPKQDAVIKQSNSLDPNDTQHNPTTKLTIINRTIEAQKENNPEIPKYQHLTYNRILQQIYDQYIR